MNDKEKAQLAVGAIAAVIVVKGIVDIRRITRLGRLDRKRIKAYKAEVHDCIENFQTKMKKIIDDPDATSEQFWSAYHEEMRFLDIVQNQILD